ncbi:MAG TPA: DegV family protein [Candidatus Aphodovivens excrementavium]|nr:DegV family protein [Candidatus Aphodovivens excrementavium]
MILITDSASDILEDEAADLRVHLVPLDIMFAGEHFTSNTHETFDNFYRLLAERDDFPVTSQPSPEAYLELYQKARREQEEVLVICLSGALSGTVESARIAADLSGWQDHITIVDTRHAIASQRLMVEEAARMRDEGKSVQEIVAHLEFLRDHIRICGVLDKLEYLRRGGRIPAGLAKVGDLLSIKAVVAVNDGAVSPVGKARGRHAGEKRLYQEFEKHPHNPAWQITFVYSLGLKIVKEFADAFCEHYSIDCMKTRMIQIGPTIGAHLGPDCVGLCFVTKDPVQ